uniref:C2H2-type domain-containing protein n=1 Tax=Chaetoceros debilis TaxID=122233 RepID=A0A7S3Q273_9STRA
MSIQGPVPDSTEARKTVSIPSKRARSPSFTDQRSTKRQTEEADGPNGRSMPIEGPFPDITQAQKTVLNPPERAGSPSFDDQRVKKRHMRAADDSNECSMSIQGPVTDSTEARKTVLIPSKRAGSPAFDRRRLTKKQMKEAVEKSKRVCRQAEQRQRKLLESIASRLFESDDEENFPCPNCTEVFSTSRALFCHNEWNLCKKTGHKIKSSRSSKLSRQQCPHCKLSLSTSGLEYHLANNVCRKGIKLKRPAVETTEKTYKNDLLQKIPGENVPASNKATKATKVIYKDENDLPEPSSESDSDDSSFTSPRSKVSVGAHTCPYCSRSFNSANTLNYHFMIHNSCGSKHKSKANNFKD